MEQTPPWDPFGRGVTQVEVQKHVLFGLYDLRVEASDGCCQTNPHAPPMHAIRALTAGLGNEVLPLDQGGRASLLERWSIDEVAFGIEMIVDIGVEGSELLQCLRLSESQHRPLSSSKRQMAVLHAIVGPAADLLFAVIAKFDHRCLVRAQAIGDDRHWSTMTFQRLADEPDCRSSVS